MSRPRRSFVKPMLAKLAAEPFDRAGWLFEVKWDGFRAIAELDGDAVRLYSRNQVGFNDSFPSLVAALRKIRQSAILDGEIVALDERGRSRFQLLQMHRKTGKGRLAYVVFDLLELDGRDWRHEPLVKRHAALKSLIGGVPGLMVSECVEERGKDFFQAACDLGLEGMIAKDGASEYRDGVRSASWLKVKCAARQEAVIAGFTAPRGSRKHIGALVLGVFEGKTLRYIGHTGGGSSDRKLAELRKKLDPLIVEKCPFEKAPRVNAPVRWVRPELVGEVRFQEWTDDGRMRQPIFLGLREDKSPRNVHREVPVDAAARLPGAS